MIVSAPFKINIENGKVIFNGWGKRLKMIFYKQIVSACKPNKLYQIKFIEVNAAGVHKNYMFMCLGMAAKELGYTKEGLRAYFERIVKLGALDEDNDHFSKDDWIIDIVDIESGEIVGHKLKSVNDWKVQMVNDFIDIIQFNTQKVYPRFVFPESKDYTGEVIGTRNEIGDDDLVMSLDDLMAA